MGPPGGAPGESPTASVPEPNVRARPAAPEFLTPAWIARLDEVVASAAELADLDADPLVVEAQVTTPEASVTYHLVLGPGPARIHPGAAGEPDLTLVLTVEAARRLHEGTANAQVCLADGTLRLRGNPEVLSRRAAALARAGGLLAAFRR